MNHLAVVAFGFGSWALLTLGTSQAAQLLDDRAITIRSPKDLAAKRAALIAHVWGQDGFPDGLLPTKVVSEVPSSVRGLTNLARVDELTLDMAPGLTGLAYHFVPQTNNGPLVVVHHGHACTFDDGPTEGETGYGLQRTIAALLREGYGVLGVFMPRRRPGDCGGSHETLFEIKTRGSPFRFFLDTVAAGLNYLESRSATDRFPQYRVFHMVGLSGGGWTTTIYAALDPRIKLSFPVAGSIPLYLRAGGSVGDLEQFEPEFYGLAGYPDLYILGGHGAGRQQIQILVRKDDCCFGEAQHDAQTAGAPYGQAMGQYAGRVQAALQELGEGSFQLRIDEVAPSHMISHHAIETIILPALQEKPPTP